MRRFISVITIQNSFSRDLNEFQKARRHQLSCDVEKDVSSDKSSSPSKQLIIENFIKE